MGELKINFGESANSSGPREVYPEGTYKVIVKNYQQVVSSKGTPQIRWFSEIKEPKEYEGKTLVDHTPLTESALFRVANLVKGCGINIIDLPTMTVMGTAFTSLMDQCKGRKTYWRISRDTTYDNNKVQECIVDEDQELLEPDISKKDDTEPPF